MISLPLNLDEAELPETLRPGGRNQNPPGGKLSFHPLHAYLDECPTDALPAHFRGDRREVQQVRLRRPVGRLDATNANDPATFDGNEKLAVKHRMVAKHLPRNAFAVIAVGVGKGLFDQVDTGFKLPRIVHV